MCDDSDQELTDLDIEMRTWNKLEKRMKSVGFREGAAKGKDITFQEGFNLGYLDGFKMGKYLGEAKGIMTCQSKLKLTSSENLDVNEKSLNCLSSQTCLFCLKDSTSEKSFNEYVSSKTIGMENLILEQQSHSTRVINSLKSLKFK